MITDVQWITHKYYHNMALIICPQCGKSISDKALKCPHCGMPIEKKTIPSNNRINIPKILLGVVVSIGGVLSIVPLFYDIWGLFFSWYFDFDYGYFTPPIFGIPTIDSYFTFFVGLFGGLSCLALCILGIIRYSKRIRTTWLYWVLSVVFSIASAFGTFVLLSFYNSSQIQAYIEKKEPAKGTYEFTDSEGVSIVFSMCEGGIIKVKGQENSEKTISIACDYREHCFIIYIVDNKDTILGYYTTDFEMTYISGKEKMKLQKISDEAIVANDSDANTDASVQYDN